MVTAMPNLNTGDRLPNDLIAAYGLSVGDTVGVELDSLDGVSNRYGVGRVVGFYGNDHPYPIRLEIESTSGTWWTTEGIGGQGWGVHPDEIMFVNAEPTVSDSLTVSEETVAGHGVPSEPWWECLKADLEVDWPFALLAAAFAGVFFACMAWGR